MDFGSLLDTLRTIRQSQSVCGSCLAKRLNMSYPGVMVRIKEFRWWGFVVRQSKTVLCTMCKRPSRYLFGLSKKGNKFLKQNEEFRGRLGVFGEILEEE